MLSGEATNTNFIVFGLTRPSLEPTIYRTRGECAYPLRHVMRSQCYKLDFKNDHVIIVCVLQVQVNETI
jgi:hypothetical protein